MADEMLVKENRELCYWFSGRWRYVICHRDYWSGDGSKGTDALPMTTLGQRRPAWHIS